MTVGERIKIARESVKMSQDELAKRLGYKDRSSISKIEKAPDDNIAMVLVRKIADILNCSPMYLMGWDEQEDEYYLNDNTRKIAQEIFDNKELGLLFDAAKDATPEDLQTVHTMLMALKSKEGT
jgi:transcriptional regulator with XRE-family HTH domain